MDGCLAAIPNKQSRACRIEAVAVRVADNGPDECSDWDRDYAGGGTEHDTPLKARSPIAGTLEGQAGRESRE